MARGAAPSGSGRGAASGGAGGIGPGGRGQPSGSGRNVQRGATDFGFDPDALAAALGISPDVLGLVGGTVAGFVSGTTSSPAITGIRGANDSANQPGHDGRSRGGRESENIDVRGAPTGVSFLDASIDPQLDQIDRVTDLFDPFVQAGQQPLSDLVNAITGQGDTGFTPSEQFTTGLERGTRATRRGAAARGLLDSSGTEARLADLVNALTGQEVQSQISNRLQPIQVAQDASRTIGGAEAAGAGAGSSIFSNLAAQNLTTAQNLGQARSSAFQSAAGGLQGLAELLATQ